ncbi:MAG: malto-oligosyltrehalose synthase [Candidatus Binataceae bacterium]
MREPLSTYRIQLNARFGFDAAAELVPYLEELGIDYLYCSPYFQAAPRSMHGYDVVDYSRVNDELGGPPAFERMCSAIERAGLRQILDIVPNHMAITGRMNPWWWDVLKNGPSSKYASYFDIDWQPPEHRIRNILLMPVLGDQYGVVLEAGKIRISREGVDFIVNFEDHAFPIAPRSLRFILAAAATRYASEGLAYLADGFGGLPAAASTDRESIARRDRGRGLMTAMLAKLIDEDPAIARALDDALEQVNSNIARLHEILEAQNYRLADWRMAARDLGYRRFFDISTLVGLRMENVRVFDATHALTLKLISDGRLTGLRIDHLDGLRDPEGYLERLRTSAPDAWIVAEKILAQGERLRESWPIDGTSGYDFLNIVGRLLVDPAGAEPLTQFYREFTDEAADFQSLARGKKQLAMRGSLGSEINRLTAIFLDVCEADPLYRDHSRHELREVLRATLACVGVYRTYAREPDEVSREDEHLVDNAITSAKAYRPDLDSRLFDFLGNILSLQVAVHTAVDLAMRFQQVSAAVMAKGLEDTAFYSYNRMIALNEVGGDPNVFGITQHGFYRWTREIHKMWPRTMLATSTHDTKRSEDVRARLFVLSEIPELWSMACREWSQISRQYRTGDFPDSNLEYHLYQAIVGAWPIEKERILEYAEKASREAKSYTSWTDRNDEYEAAVRNFVEGIYSDSRFCRAVDEFVASISNSGRINSLVQTLIKLTAPGVPDFYQGCEVWNLSLVDPDNRRAVDFDCRRALLKQIGVTKSPEQIMERVDEGLPKLWLIKQGLALRRRHPEWFGAEADIQRLRVRGSRSDYAIAYVRAGSVIAVAPRLTKKLAGQWRGTAVDIPEGTWLNHLTGDRLGPGINKMEDILRRFPVALLSREVGPE